MKNYFPLKPIKHKNKQNLWNRELEIIDYSLLRRRRISTLSKKKKKNTKSVTFFHLIPTKLGMNWTKQTVKPNWIGPKAAIRTQNRTETESRITEVVEPITLDCLEPILYQLPVWRNGFWRSLPSPLSSLKLIFLTQKVFVKMSQRRFLERDVAELCNRRRVS